MVMFKQYFIEKIVNGEKTQTRRVHQKTWQVGKAYPVQTNWRGKPEAHILVTRKFQHRLGDISSTEIRKEGFSSFDEFRLAWIGINGCWDPDCVVLVYEFCVVNNTGV